MLTQFLCVVHFTLLKNTTRVPDYACGHLGEKGRDWRAKAGALMAREAILAFGHEFLALALVMERLVGSLR